MSTKLLDRRLAADQLTTSGAALIVHAEEILTAMERAKAAVAAVEEGRSAPLALGATESVCSYRLPIFLRMMSRLMPNLKVEVETGTTTRLRQQLIAGRPSVVLVNGTNEGHRYDPEAEADSTLLRRVLWEEDVLMVGTPTAVAQPKRVLMTGRGCVYRDITERDFLDRLPEAEPMQVGNLEGVKSAVVAGLGIGLLPAVAVQPWLTGGQLVAMPLRTKSKVTTSVAWNDRTCPTGVARHLRRLHAR